MGSMIEADRRLRAFEVNMRRRKRIERDTELWRQFENDFEERGTPGVGSEGAVHRDWAYLFESRPCNLEGHSSYTYYLLYDC